MKVLTIIAVLCMTFPAMAQESKDAINSEVTTYYLVRHAEKNRSDASNKNPGLTEEGKARAQQWAEVFNKIPFDIIYSTNYNRTLQTAAPTAMAQGVEVKSYDPRNLFDEKFQEATVGKTVLVVGHSNTTPAFVNAILGENEYENMDDSDNASLYVVTIVGDVKRVQILTIE